MQLTRQLLVAVTAVSSLVATTAAAAPAGSDATAGTLTVNASLALSSRIGACTPPEGATACAARTIQGPFPGLGQVSGRYEFYVYEGPPCADGYGKALAYQIRFTVAGKGEIHVAVAEAAECVPEDAIRTQTQMFTVTGGTGMYVGASGSGTLERTLGRETPTGRHGRESWKGTLVVPGIEVFDVTPPMLSGAVAMTVRAARGATRAPVTYAVTARDDVDGAVPVSCRPRSGSRFRIGRTRVTCSATDTSGNTATAMFTVTVKRRH
jgi:HYR domain